MKAEDLNWIITWADDKIASVDIGWKGLERTAKWIASGKSQACEVHARRVSMSELRSIDRSVGIDDLVLMGTEFQQRVWRSLFELTHPDRVAPGLFSYTEFANRCGNAKAIRAIAHAVGLNPINYIVPCHLIVPIESLRRIEEAYEEAMDTIFKGRDLYVFDTFDMGEYGLGRKIKRSLIAYDLEN